MIGEAEREDGLRAYEQVLAFAALRKKRLRLIYVLFTLVLAGMGVAALIISCYRDAARANVDALMGVAFLIIAAAFALFAIWNWRRLQALDVRNRALLARLHAQYGDDLPWLQVERQMDEIRKIEAELAENPSDGMN
jgi:protein-S-isoprenylcysteine O-methyltransferase Ste14